MLAQPLNRLKVQGQKSFEVAFGLRPATSNCLFAKLPFVHFLKVTLLLSVFLVACFPARGPIRRIQATDEIQPPLFDLVEGQTFVERFDPPGAGANVELVIAAQVSNPNNFGITLESVAFDVSLAGERVLRGELEPDIFIGAGLQVPLKFSLDSSLEGRTSLIKAVAQTYTGASLNFMVTGSSVFSSLDFTFDTRRSTLLSGQMNARDTVTPPGLRIDDGASSAFMLRADAPVVQVLVDIDNPGEVGYFVYGRDVALYLNAQEIAVQDIVPSPLPAGEGRKLELLYYPDLDRLTPEARAALNAVLNGTTTAAELRGELLLDVLGVDTFSVPEGWNLSGFIDTD